jgi:glutamine amidotransferase
MLVVVDYGRGNLFSISSALDHIEVPHRISGKPEDILAADRIILPGVGAFGDAMTELKRRQLVEPLLEVARRGNPFLGICVGYQVLFDRGEEFGGHAGLGLLPGVVKTLPMSDPPDDDWRVPNVGWRRIFGFAEKSLFSRLDDDAMVYFVHSYLPVLADPALATARFEFSGSECAAAAQRDNLFGMQFHPERSGRIGLELLRRFAGSRRN